MITAVRQQLPEPITTYRGLCNLPHDVIADLKSSAEFGEVVHIFWAAMTSTALEKSVAVDYLQGTPREGASNALFVIEDVDEGLFLQPLSQYPREAEFLLGMFSLLEVVDVDDQGPVVVRPSMSCLSCLSLA